MRKIITRLIYILFPAIGVMSVSYACSGENDDPYILNREDIKVKVPESGFSAVINEVFRIDVESVTDRGISYNWYLGADHISNSKDLEYKFTSVGNFTLTLAAKQGSLSYDYSFGVTVTKTYVLKREDIKIEASEGAEGVFTARVNKLFKVTVTSVSDYDVSYRWFANETTIAKTKNLEHMFEKGGAYDLKLTASQGDIGFDYEFLVVVENGPIDPPPFGSNPYITKVLDYMPAVGQFTNKLPLYEAGDNQQIMSRKVLESIGNNNMGMITLGGYGGYVVVGFDHTIQNIQGMRDFRILGNAFFADANPRPGAPQGGSCEPGIIMVAYDANGNGEPDEDEWYEIAGSAHFDPAGEPWYQLAVDNGNDVATYFDYRITYYKPEKEPDSESEWNTYIRWEDNRGNSGYKVKNQFHTQPYYPRWAGSTLSFTGTRLPQNGIDESGMGSYYVLYKFRYGYADNEYNEYDDSCIDIGWAVDKQGNKVNLPGVDFIKIYTAVNQENGWLGECSTEIMGVEDLHLLGEEIISGW